MYGIDQKSGSFNSHFIQAWITQTPYDLLGGFHHVGIKSGFFGYNFKDIHYHDDASSIHMNEKDIIWILFFNFNNFLLN